jgi:hypothetical protein
MLQKTVIQQNKVKDPYCMLALAVIERARRDNDLEWFETPAYRWYLDFISACTGIELPYDLRPQ